MNKKIFGFFFGVLSSVFLISVISCSQVFDAGVSGQVFYYESGNKIPVADIEVCVYTSEKGAVVAKAKTNQQGNFTVNRIVWKTTKSDFGKTADYQDIFVEIPYNEDHDDFRQKHPGKIPVTVVSGSTNAEKANIEVEKVRCSMPVFTGKVSNILTEVTGADTIQNEFDEKRIFLCSSEDLESRYFQRAGWAITTYGIERSDVEAMSTRTIYNHGNFSLGGSSIKYKLTSDQLNQAYPEETVYLIFDADEDLNLSVNDYIAKITFYCSDSEVPVLASDFRLVN